MQNINKLPPPGTIDKRHKTHTVCTAADQLTDATNQQQLGLCSSSNSTTRLAELWKGSNRHPAFLASTAPFSSQVLWQQQQQTCSNREPAVQPRCLYDQCQQHIQHQAHPGLTAPNKHLRQLQQLYLGAAGCWCSVAVGLKAIRRQVPQHMLSCTRSCASFTGPDHLSHYRCCPTWQACSTSGVRTNLTAMAGRMVGGGWRKAPVNAAGPKLVAARWWQ